MRRQSLVWCPRGDAPWISPDSRGAKAQFEALSAAVFDWSCSQMDNCPWGALSRVPALSLQSVCSNSSESGLCFPSLCLSQSPRGSVSRCSRDGMSRPGCQHGAPLEGDPVLSHAAARTAQTQAALCGKLVPADGNALRCVFAWRNWESVYLLVL